MLIEGRESRVCGNVVTTLLEADILYHDFDYVDEDPEAFKQERLLQWLSEVNREKFPKRAPRIPFCKSITMHSKSPSVSCSPTQAENTKLSISLPTAGPPPPPPPKNSPTDPSRTPGVVITKVLTPKVVTPKVLTHRPLMLESKNRTGCMHPGGRGRRELKVLSVPPLLPTTTTLPHLPVVGKS